MCESRREFLERGATGLALTWGGLKVFARPPGDSARSGSALPPHDLIYGSHVYRPPNPPREIRREVLRTFSRQYHFNLMRAFPTWDYYHRGPGQYIFDEIEELMEYCDEFGLKVMMGIVIETAPYWLEQAHPETRFVDPKGEPRRLQGHSSHITGGFPSLCLDWQPVQDAARDFIRALARVVAPHPSMYVWDVWNEPHIQPANGRNPWVTPPELLYCYCGRTIAEFRKWLRQRYGTIEKLNAAWTRLYPNWEAVDAPRALGTAADWVDWRRYMIDRNVWEMRFRSDTVRTADSRHIVGSHAGSNPPLDSFATTGTSGSRLAEVVDLWGLSLFPRVPGVHLSDAAAKMELTRSNARGKEFWLTELQGGDSRLNLISGGFHMRPKDIRSYNWVAIAAGTKGIVYWQYMAESTGGESTRNGLVTRDGGPTDRVEEAARNHALIQAHWDTVIKSYRPKPQVAILYDPDCALLTFALTGSETSSINAIRGYYKSLWNLDLPVDFVEPADLAYGQYKAVVAPWHLVGKQATCELLRHFVEAGGVLVLEAAFGQFDERFYYNPVIPPHGLTETFGYREKQNFLVRDEKLPADMSPDDAIYYQPVIEFSEPAQVRITARTFLTPLQLTSAKPIATCKGMTLAARKKVGRGEVFYVGTSLGATLAAGDPGAMELLRAAIGPAVKAAVSATNLRPRLMRGTSQSLLAIFNDTPRDETERIDLPAEFRRATDIHSGAAIPLDGHGVRVAVPSQDVIVLRLDV